MKTSIDFLDAVIVKTGAASDYAVAKKLDVKTQTVSVWRVGKGFMSDETCLKVAEILEIDPAIVLAAVHAERAKTQSEKNAWIAMFEKLGGMTAALTLGIMLNGVTAPNANAGAAGTVQNNALLSIHYTKCRRKKPRFSAMHFMVTQILRMS